MYNTHGLIMLSEKPYLQKIIYNKQAVPAELTSQYPYNISFLSQLNELNFHPDVTFIVGENGAGKSTLIEALALGLGFSAEGGTRNFNVETATTTSSLHQHFKFIRSYKKPSDYYFLRAESFFNVATYMDETHYLEGYGGKSLHAQSHGEAFLALLNHKLRGNGLYIFDEPEAALSPQRQLAAVSAIHQLVQKKSQFIIATHSPIIMAYPNALILWVNNEGIHPLKLEDTEHFKVYDLFFKDYQRLIRQVMQTG
jgi:predicted ATPase